jgi:hypothetical protein
MPWTFNVYDRFSKDGLVVIGVHVDTGPDGGTVDSPEKLDAKLVDIRKNIWHGRAIPYPVAIARPERNNAVAEDYGLNGYPTLLLIDRRGNLVDEVDIGEKGLALIRKKLAEPPGPTSQTNDRR